MADAFTELSPETLHPANHNGGPNSDINQYFYNKRKPSL